MGLDMYAYTVPASMVGDQQVDIRLDFDNPEVNTEFGYWRKFHQLHGWMHRLYIAKGGNSATFNCDTVRLMPDDLDQLEKDAAKGLPDEHGFFFGNGPGNDYDDERRKEIADFISKAREELDDADGRAIIYDSWW